jgi:hypothetical protein
MGIEGLSGACPAEAKGEFEDMLVQCILIMTFVIGRCFDMDTANEGKSSSSSEGREGIICMEMAADGLGSAATTAVTGTGELAFILVCSFSLTLLHVADGRQWLGQRTQSHVRVSLHLCLFIDNFFMLY